MTLITTLCIGLALTGLFKIQAANGRPKTRMKEGDACPIDFKFPKSYCELPNNCLTTRAYIEAKLFSLDEIPSCGFLNAFQTEMLCCPSKLPGTQTTQAPSSINNKTSYSHLATFAYLAEKTYDDFVYRCTAIILSSTQVLATSLCAGSKLSDKPSKVLVGVNDVEEDFDYELETEIKPLQIKHWHSDLALFEPKSPLDMGKPLMSNVSTATLCTESDLEGNPKLHVVGYSQKNDGTNCHLFLKEVVKHDDCTKVQNDRQVEGLGEPGLHLCVAPIWDDSQTSDNEGCQNCLTASSSVLHVERNDGSICVAGIATPTTKECVVNKNPLYYTSIVNDAANDFIRGYSPVATL